jgi:hypothetical protein
MKHLKFMTISLLGLVVLLLVPAQSWAHPEDDFVQSSVIVLTASQILVDVNLTPGFEIGAEVVQLIDTNLDQIITEVEALTYAAEVATFLRLEVGGNVLSLELLSFEYPSYDSFVVGRHGITLHLSTPLPADEPGNYQLFYQNTYEPDGFTNSYLVNGFVQANSADVIDIIVQERDYYQHTLSLEYAILSPLQDTALVVQTRRWLHNLLQMLGMDGSPSIYSN